MNRFTRIKMYIVILLLYTGCGTTNEKGIEEPEKDISLKIETPQFGNYHYSWNSTDTVGVFTNEIQNRILTDTSRSLSYGEPLSCVLSASTNFGLFYYPYNSTVHLNANKLYISLPTEQKFVGNDTILASSIPFITNLEQQSILQLKPISGLLKLALKGNIELSTISFQSNKENCSGDGYIDLSDKEHYPKWKGLSVDATTSIVLTNIEQELSDSLSKSYLLVLPEGTYNDYTLVFYSTDHKSYAYSNLKEITTQKGNCFLLDTITIHDSAYDPKPDPDPIPTPNPDPTPDPDPVPTPDPDPIPDPDPVPTPDPEPDPLPNPEKSRDTLWVKGVTPPADKWIYENYGTHELQYIPAYNGCKWYDIDKQYITELGTNVVPDMYYGVDDYYLCWAAAATNVIHYTLDRYEPLLKQLPGYNVTKPKYWLVRPLRGNSNGQISEIMEAFKKKYPDAGGYAYIGYLDYLFGGKYFTGLLNPWLDSDEIDKTLKTYPRPSLSELSEAVRKVLKDEGIFTFSIKEELGLHEITAWGAIFNEQGLVEKIFITNSDDPAGLLAVRIIEKDGRAYLQKSSTRSVQIVDLQLFGGLDSIIKSKLHN